MQVKRFEILLKRLAELDVILNSATFEKSNAGSNGFIKKPDLSFILKGTQFEEEVEAALLKNEMIIVIENEEFERAAEIRDKLIVLEKNKERLQDLRLQMKLAVKNQEFEKAAGFRDEILSLKAEPIGH